MTSAGARIRVLVVEDSPSVRELLTHVLGADPQLRVIGAAHNGEEAIEAVARLKPDVVTMDYHMPRMNGLDATRTIMQMHPVPIVIVAGSSAREEVASGFRLLEAGALAVVRKPAGPGHPEHEASAGELVQTVKLMSEVKVVRRWRRAESATPAAPPAAAGIAPAPADARLVAIGASTGGPVALKTILAGLPRDFPLPIAIVQHISPGFTEGLVAWLAQATGFPVHAAEDRLQPLAGHVYVAPDGFHLAIGPDERLVLSEDEPENGHRPAVSHLFRSVAKVHGARAVAVLLTGMGKDGAAELARLRELGAVTIAQDEESSVVHGMPGEAIRLNAATHVLPAAGIASALAALASARRNGNEKPS
jgi:two-component system chemotaxis response regulator CheB